MRLLITRPEPDALKLRAAVEDLGCQATVEPLLRVTFEDCDRIEIDGAQALIATSRNALRALKSHPVLARARALPLFAVGKATANEARSLGFEMVVTGAGTGQELVTHIVSVADPAAGLLVHLAGEVRATDLVAELEPHGFRVLQPVVYRMLAAKAFSDAAIEQLALGEIGGVILMSPRTASIYAVLVRRHGLIKASRGLIHYCLSQAVVRRLEPLGTVRSEVAQAPRQEELLALIAVAAAQLGR
jgi:uroporphyrinogen-III synthase